ncbi:hypothetical protein [Streptomyces sp. PanSC9]|uniref:hypothetical protein n=1 Tax=Streptomyces sp. PanSC9 TaxID=1520461 RepID=UPI0026913FF1|nr:hypothetical protein [Streptomyces sp. PanSC9]
MGSTGPGLPGQRSALVDADRTYVARLWNQGVPACTNPVASVANRKTVIAGLEAAAAPRGRALPLQTHERVGLR